MDEGFHSWCIGIVIGENSQIDTIRNRLTLLPVQHYLAVDFVIFVIVGSVIIMPPGDGEKDPDVRYTDVTKESGKLATNRAHDYQSC